MASIDPDIIGQRSFEENLSDPVGDFYHEHIWPETWVPLHDYAILGVRKEEDHSVHEDALLEEAAAPKPAPPEAYLNVYKALEEIYRVIGPHQPAHRRTAELLEEFRALSQEGHLSPDALTEVVANLERTADNHARRSEEIMTWFLETYFRDFDDLTEGITNLIGPAQT